MGKIPYILAAINHHTIDAGHHHILLLIHGLYITNSTQNI